MDDATRMRDGGQSWTDIAETLRISVPEAKARVREDKRARREGLARTAEAENRNGLRDLCECGHMKKQHVDREGECEECGPPRQERFSFSWSDDDETHLEWVGCDEFLQRKIRPLPLTSNMRYYGRRGFKKAPPEKNPKKPAPEYIDPETSLHDGVAIQARQLGVPQKVRQPPSDEAVNRRPQQWWPRGATVPQPRLETMVRRARKKLKQGKKLKRRYDAPNKNERI